MVSKPPPATTNTHCEKLTKKERQKTKKNWNWKKEIDWCDLRYPNPIQFRLSVLIIRWIFNSYALISLFVLRIILCRKIASRIAPAFFGKHNWHLARIFRHSFVQHHSCATYELDDEQRNKKKTKKISDVIHWFFLSIKCFWTTH